MFVACTALITGGALPTTVASVAVTGGFISPSIATVAVLVTPGAAAAVTATVRVMLLVAPEARGPGFVQVTTWPLALQVQPSPVAETNVRPAGSVSVSVMV